MIAYQKSPGRAVTLIVQRHRTGTNESAKDEPTKKIFQQTSLSDSLITSNITSNLFRCQTSKITKIDQDDRDSGQHVV